MRPPLRLHSVKQGIDGLPPFRCVAAQGRNLLELIHNQKELHLLRLVGQCLLDCQMHGLRTGPKGLVHGAGFRCP